MESLLPNLQISTGPGPLNEIPSWCLLLALTTAKLQSTAPSHSRLSWKLLRYRTLNLALGNHLSRQESHRQEDLANSRGKIPKSYPFIQSIMEPSEVLRSARMNDPSSGSVAVKI